MTNQNVILPAIALRGTTILPGMIVHFDVSRERSKKAIEAAMLHDQKIFLVTQKDPKVEKPELSELYQVGTVAYIKQVVKLPHDLLRVLVEGIERAELLGLEQEEPFLKAETALFEPDGAQYTKSLKEAMFRSIQELFQRYCMESGKISKDLAAQIMNITELEELIPQISVNVPLTYQNKQKILEAVSLENQYEVLAVILNNEIEVLQIGHDLQRKLKARVDKNQRDYILREQLKLIREELGEENTADTAEEYRQKAEALDAPQEVKDKLNKEIDRFKSMNNAAAESSVLSTYIETLLGLPWNKKSEDSTDLKEAWKILEEGHYGLKDVKERIMEFLAVRKLTSGGKSPILCLVGPPGTGKTLLAKAVAGEAEVPFFSISGSEFVEMFVGMGAAKVRDLFKQANEKAPCIVFIDEIDTIGKKRDGSGMGGGNDEREQTLNQLLTEMDGFDGSKGVVILAATNRPDSLDPALLRPGRFDRRIPVELPDLQGREEILKVHAKKIKIADSVRFDEIAKAAVGASGAELANIVNEAALRAVRDGRKFATQADFEESIEVVIAGYQKKNRVLSNKEKLIVSYHEVGHALVAAKQTDSAPVHKITIIPRTSGALGYTMQVDEQEHFLMSKEELENKIATFTGGRAAEELIFHSITTGASNDIEQATKIARAMISRYGMSDDFDMVAMENVSNQYLGGDASLTCSFETQTLLDKKVVELVRREHEKATKILTDNIGKLHEIAKYLYEHETITGEEFMKILNEKPDEIEEIQENETRQ